MIGPLRIGVAPFGLDSIFRRPVDLKVGGNLTFLLVHLELVTEPLNEAPRATPGGATVLDSEAGNTLHSEKGIKKKYYLES